MPQTMRIIGGAGTGKTTRLLELMEKCFERGIRDPMQVGFVTFTRAARREASERASAKFGISIEELEKRGWFRTIHSICYRILETKSSEVLDGSRKKLNEWAKKYFGDEYEMYSSINPEQSKELFSFSDDSFSTETKLGTAIRIWNISRSRMESFEDSWEREQRSSSIGEGLSIDVCRKYIYKYEEAKSEDGKYDFTDLLMRVAGVGSYPKEGIYTKVKEGDIPGIPVWFFDEQQDTSKLLDMVCKRLVEYSKWVYVVGDPYQAIYGFAGSDSSCFTEWKTSDNDYNETLPVSYRVPKSHWDLAESQIKRIKGWEPRNIKPKEKIGTIVEEHDERNICDYIYTSKEQVLVLARTNNIANRLSKRIEGDNIPWIPISGMGGFNAPVNVRVVLSFHELQSGGVIDGKEWTDILTKLPHKDKNGMQYTERGTAADWKKNKDLENEYDFVNLKRLDILGATDHLKEVIRTGRWKYTIFNKAERITDALLKWGRDVVINPFVRIGTIHSAKGLEADTVIVSTSTTEKIENGMSYPDLADEERRLWYVAFTRSRNKLVIIDNIKTIRRYHYL